MRKIPITSEGYDQMKERLKQLKGVERPNIIQAISEAREHGDLSENAEYHAAREEHSLNEGRIKDLESKISLAEVVDTTTLSGNKVIFGAYVVLEDEETEKEINYQIVGEFEADIKNQKISITSPVSRAILAKEVGDSVEVKTPGGVKYYEIKKISFK